MILDPSSFDAFAQMFFLMAAGHALADRPLQTDLMRVEKDRRKSPGRWPFGLAVHGLIHGGLVAFITGIWWLGVAELVMHALIDDAKCMGKISLKTDQAVHLACKLIWALVALDCRIVGCMTI
jgi:hypothetical protein